MSKGISIKNIDELEIIRFYHFQLLYDDDFKRVVFQVSISFDFFNVDTSLDAEEFDFINLKDCLLKIFSKEWNSFIFNPIGEQFVIHFSLDENENVHIKVKISNPLFTGKLEIQFTMKLNSIPFIIENIDRIFA